MTFFVQDSEEDVYHRFDECHVQRAYSVEVLTKWLEEAGFTVLRVTGDFERIEVTEQTERIFFMAKEEWIKEKQPIRLLFFYRKDVVLVLEK